MRKKILILILGISIILFTEVSFSYTAPNYDNVNLNLSSDYTAPSYSSINLTLGPLGIDTCTCPGAGNNWEVNMEDECHLTSDCNLGTGNLSWTGSSGFFNCSAELNLTNRNAPPNGTIFYFNDGCKIIHLIISIFILNNNI